MLRGNLAGLSAIEREELEQLRNWRNNPDFRKYFREYRELNMDMQERWFDEKLLKDPTTIMFSIKKLSDNELLGCCGFVYINWIHRHGDLSLYIGWNNSYIDDYGYAEDSCNLLFDYGFNELGLHKIWTEIYEFDDKKMKLYEKFGFHQDGLLREHYFYNGKWWDSIILSLLSAEFNEKGQR